MSATIRTSSGQTTHHDTLDDATAWAIAQGWCVGEWDGERKLCWATKEDAEDDDGRRAVAEIVVA